MYGLLSCSHALPGFAKLQSTYGKFDIESRQEYQGTGWISNDPQELQALDPESQWLTHDFRMGDAVLFGMNTLHMSTVNSTGARIRLSGDVRWQPADEPRDDRYIGTQEEMAVKQAQRKPAGTWNRDTAANAVTMADLRREWGI